MQTSPIPRPRKTARARETRLVSPVTSTNASARSATSSGESWLVKASLKEKAARMSPLVKVTLTTIGRPPNPRTSSR